MALKLAISASILTAVSVPMLAQAKVASETVQIVPRVDERDAQIVRLHSRLALVTHRWRVRGKVIHRLRRRLRERETFGARGVVASRRPGLSRSLSRSGRFLATCYDLSGTTATGRPVGPGIIAVDPSVIPLGSHVWVQGYGNAIAADTGGAIIGHHIDEWHPFCGGWPNPTVEVRW